MALLTPWGEMYKSSAAFEKLQVLQTVRKYKNDVGFIDVPHAHELIVEGLKLLDVLHSVKSSIP